MTFCVKGMVLYTILTIYIFITLLYFQPYSLLSESRLVRMRHLIYLIDSNHPKKWQINPLQLCLLNFDIYIPPLHSLIEGKQNMMGIHNVAAIFFIPLIPYCWDTKYGNHILYPLKDQRGDTEYGRHTKYGVTPVI